MGRHGPAAAGVGAWRCGKPTSDQLLREHRALIEAGTDAISTITFGALPRVLAEYRLADLASEINYAAARMESEALVRGGVDILHVEHCMDMENLRAAMAAISSLGISTPVMISADIELMGTMLDGTTSADRVRDTSASPATCRQH